MLGLARRAAAAGCRSLRRDGRGRLGVRRVRAARVRALQAGPRIQRGCRHSAAAEDVVAHYQVSLPSMVYYLRRHVDEYFDRRLCGPCFARRVYAVLSADDYAESRGAIGARTCVFYRRPTFEVKLQSVLARQPLPNCCWSAIAAMRSWTRGQAMAMETGN